MIQLDVKTNDRTQFVDITSEVRDAIRDNGLTEGVCTVFVPHTTAGITINENADPSVVRDIINTLEKLVPYGAGYSHSEGNADSHVKASLMGASVNIPIVNGRLQLGTWQGIYFCEFDGPRSRRVWICVTAA